MLLFVTGLAKKLYKILHTISVFFQKYWHPPICAFLWIFLDPLLKHSPVFCLSLRNKLCLFISSSYIEDLPSSKAKQTIQITCLYQTKHSIFIQFVNKKGQSALTNRAFTGGWSPPKFFASAEIWDEGLTARQIAG